MARITATYQDGHRFSGETHEEVMLKIWLSSLDKAASLPEFMEGMSKRIKLITHVTISPDPQSLLEGQALLGIITLVQGKVISFPSAEVTES